MKHLHHIIPKHAGGTDDPSNLVELTVEEHAEAHRILFEQYGRWEDEIAWKGLSGIIGHEEAVKIAQSAHNIQTHLGRKRPASTIEKMKQNHKGMRGRKHSNETKAIMSIVRKGKSTWSKGKKLSEETKMKMKLSQNIRRQKEAVKC